VREADILVHVVDISHAGFEEQIDTVNETLSEIKTGEKPTIYVFNKIDAFEYTKKDDDDLSAKTRDNLSLEELKNSWMGKNNTPSLFISATEKENIEEFKKVLYEQVKKVHITRFPYNDFLYDIDWTKPQE
jgi:GTP-binding protein HflX